MVNNLLRVTPSETRSRVIYQNSSTLLITIQAPGDISSFVQQNSSNILITNWNISDCLFVYVRCGLIRLTLIRPIHGGAFVQTKLDIVEIRKKEEEVQTTIGGNEYRKDVRISWMRWQKMKTNLQHYHPCTWRHILEHKLIWQHTIISWSCDSYHDLWPGSLKWIEHNQWSCYKDN